MPASTVKRGEQCFPRSSRLVSKLAYQQVFQKPERISDRNFTILYRLSDSHCRLGLAIAKKKVHKAVDRNKIKRQIRESFRRHKNDLPAIDMVVLANASCHKRSKKELNESLVNLWLRLQDRIK